MPFKPMNQQMGKLPSNPMMMQHQMQGMNAPAMMKPPMQPGMRPPMPKMGGLGSLNRLKIQGSMR